MRYHSLRFIASLYHFFGFFIGVCVVVLFFIFAYGAVQLLQTIAVATGSVPGFENYAAVLLPPFGFLLGGIITAISTYAAGTFLIVIMDIEENTRLANYRQPLHREEDAPVAPKPWASFPPNPNLHPQKDKLVPRGTYDERLRDMKRR